jgi:hypothetical protein
LLMLGETIMWSGWLGISFLVSGIWLVVIDPGQNSSTTKTERAMRSYCCFWKRTSGNHPPSAFFLGGKTCCAFDCTHLM